ncbi:dihydrolipoyl dehydrogenase [Spirochaetota bacterium]
MDKKVDVAVIGAGSAGLFAVSEIRKVTDNFIIINGGQYGTTCARVGCMPSKTLIHGANEFHGRLKMDRVGIRGGEKLSADIPEILKHVRSLRDSLVGNVIAGISSNKKYNIDGYAKFIEPNALKVEGQIIRAKKIVIATGSSPVIPGPWNKFRKYLFTSDDIFEMDDLPKSVGLIGLGVIGIELGQAMSRLGINVVGLDMQETMAGISDPVILESAKKIIGDEFPLWFGEKAELQEEGGKIRLKSGKRTELVDKVLVSMGRRPNLKGLELEKIGIPLSERGIPEHDYNTMRVKDMPIYIAGDATAERALMHEAADEGRISGYNAVRDKDRKFKRRTPLGICFSDPNIASSGMRYSEAWEKEPVIGEFNFEKQGRARTMQENSGHIRIYACPETGKILGSEMIAPAGEHLAHMLSWAIQNKMDVFSLLRMPYYHPVIEEGMQMALKMIAKKIGTSRSSSTLDMSLCTDNCLDVLC